MLRRAKKGKGPKRKAPAKAPSKAQVNAEVHYVPPVVREPIAREVTAGIVEDMRAKFAKRQTGKKKQEQKRVAPVTLLSDGRVESEVTEWISTGFPNLDTALGGGWPVGRISEVFGPEGTGKSALTHMAIQQCLRGGGIPFVYDYERALDHRVKQQLSIDPMRVIYSTPLHIEQMWNMLWDSFERLKKAAPEGPSLIIVDSLGAAGAKVQVEDFDAEEDSDVAALARALSKGWRKLIAELPKVRAHAIFVNQIRAKFGVASFMKMHDTPGGYGMKHNATLRIKCHRTKGGLLKRGGLSSALVLGMQTVKNKIAPPFQRAEWVIDFEKGPSAVASAFRGLLGARLIKASGGGTYTSSLIPRKTFHNPLTTVHDDWYTLMEDPAVYARVMDAFMSCVNADK